MPGSTLGGGRKEELGRVLRKPGLSLCTFTDNQVNPSRLDRDGSLHTVVCLEGKRDDEKTVVPVLEGRRPPETRLLSSVRPATVSRRLCCIVAVEVLIL